MVKYRDPRTGRRYNGVRVARIDFCYMREDCDETCPLFAATDGREECFDWCLKHPDEAARMMGLEVLRDAEL